MLFVFVSILTHLLSRMYSSINIIVIFFIGNHKICYNSVPAI